MFSRRKTADPIYDMKMIPGRFTYELVSEMERRTNAEAPRFRFPKAGVQQTARDEENK